MIVKHGERARARDSVSEKIDHLFLSIRRPDGREYTYDEVEAGTEGRVSRSYIWKLRHGRNRNPSLDVIEALSEFFGVPPGYFFGASSDGSEDLALSAVMRDSQTRALVERTRGLSPAAFEAVVAMIEHLRAVDTRVS
jgi:transcriptional regulator with XRE-family HTH domain